MHESIENKIINKIEKAGRVSLFFVDYFIDFGNSKAVNKALERLVQKKKLSGLPREYTPGPKLANYQG